MRDHSPTLRNLDVIENSVGFDADWYERSYPDCGFSGLDPRAHYATFGYRLGRGLSKALAIPELDELTTAALHRQPVISYCIPIMNRPDDIKGTLAWNLDANRPLADLIEFIIVFMDTDIETHDWVRSTFREDLRSGYLRLIIAPPLESWHFGKAKNIHSPYAIGGVYSSLDGDNFVTLSESKQLLRAHENHPNGFVLHHFTGNWGDGSSGRISMPMHIYRDIGYDESFLPRQYDEMDVLLSALVGYPDIPLLRIKGQNHGFSSKRSVKFFNEVGLTNRMVEIEPTDNRPPLNPKVEGYVQEDLSMGAMTDFNQGLCFMKNAPSPDLRSAYLKLVIAGRHKVIDTVSGDKILSMLFRGKNFPRVEDLAIGTNDVCIFSCMKNDDQFLPAFYTYYKKLGIKQFFIVDDGSDVPISQTLPFDDVHVFRPKVGTFLTAKGLWIEGIMKAYLEPGQWALTLDADEFVDLPGTCNDFTALVRQLVERRQDIMAGLLIDVVPRPDVTEKELDGAETDFLKIFDHYVFEPGPVPDTYSKEPSISWAFGPNAQLSWHLDTRYHGFGTFDSLRKIPLIQVRHGRHINQGFHTLHYTDKTPEPKHEIWNTDMVLTIRHFKLLKLFSTVARKRMASLVASPAQSAYHARTTANIARIFSSGGEEQMRRILSLPSRPLSDNFLKTISPREFQLLRPGAT